MRCQFTKEKAFISFEEQLRDPLHHFSPPRENRYSTDSILIDQRVPKRREGKRADWLHFNVEWAWRGSFIMQSIARWLDSWRQKREKMDDLALKKECVKINFSVLWSSMFLTFECSISFKFIHSKVSFNNRGITLFTVVSKNSFPALQSFSLAYLSHVKLLKAILALFLSWIFLKSHRCTIKYFMGAWV